MIDPRFTHKNLNLSKFKCNFPRKNRRFAQAFLHQKCTSLTFDLYQTKIIKIGQNNTVQLSE